MEKLACHVEWGRLKISGRPLLTGAALGSSQLMFIACRASPFLVHLFQDSNLVSIWRFPADPVFLLLGPALHNKTVEDIAGDSNSSNGSLLVITADGRVWLLRHLEKYDPLNDRSTKKRKETVPEELQKAVQEMLVGSDMKSLMAEKIAQPKQGDNNLQDNYTHGIQKSGLFHRGRPPTRRDDYVSNNSQGSFDLKGLNSAWRKVSSNTFPRFDSNLKLKVVSEKEFFCCVPGTVVAAWGPNDAVALLGVSGTVKLVRVGSSGPPPSAFAKPDMVCGRSVPGSELCCLLFASVATQRNSDERPEGYITMFQENFFKKLFGCADNNSAASGILHGDTKGHLYTSLVSPELELFQTRLLCDFGQPIVAAFAVPATGTSLKKKKLVSEEDRKTAKLHSCSLLIIGQLGKVILITGVKDTDMQVDDGLFWPTSRSFSWRSKNALLARQLNERSFSFHEWEVFSPVTSACMLGPYRLCYCTRSEIFYTDLVENDDEAQIYPRQPKANSEAKDSVSQSLLKLSQKLQPSASKDMIGGPLFKKELSTQKVPVVDIVALAGKGVSVATGSSRPLVGLTARGRLLSVEVSHHVSSRAVGVAEGIPKSWRPLLSRMEVKIQDILRVVGETAESTHVIKNHSATINLALKELAGALPLAREISLYMITVRRPDISLVGEPPQGMISSFLTVTDHNPVIVSPETLSFSPGSGRRLPLSSFYSRKVKIAIRLCNRSLHFLSPHWSLILELRAVNATQSVHFSLPINRGLGLPVGGEFTHEFIALLPGKGLGPVGLFVFLCHHQKYHQLIVEAEPSLFSCDGGFVHTKGKELPSRQVDSFSSKLGDIVSNAGCLELSPSSGSVFVALSKYRIDILSISQVRAPSLAIDPRVQISSDKKHANLDVNEDLSLRKFSSRITLSSVRNKPEVEGKDISKLLQDLSLDDLPKRGVAFKAGQRICVSAHEFGTFSISVNAGTAGGDCTAVDIALESSSLLLGSYLREALLWRLDCCKDVFVLKERCPWQQTATSVRIRTLASKLVSDADRSSESLIDSSRERSQEGPAEPLLGKAMDFVTEINDRLAVISDLWENVISFRDGEQFSSLLKETHTAVGDVTAVYRICREEDLSGR
ncbi:hypothetical protein R1flu_011120 [Riccia fluitans]|uniref:Uncharacterized protein n=1 Tax=Riccia fluitans TaxID=41844 RepID=A0ABD1Z7V1_9MARC